MEQGSIAVWEGEKCTSCAMDGKRWSAVDSTCYFPIDMAKKADTYEIAKICGGNMQKGWLIVKTKECELEEIEFPDKKFDKFVSLSKEDLNRHYGEQTDIKPLFQEEGGAPQFSIPIGEPATTLPSGDSFGACRTFNGEPKSRHTGVDYLVGKANNILSIADGTVVLVADHFFAGKSVYINHGNGLVSMYFHMSELSAKKGQKVKKGDAIGKVGETGRTTGPHLHLGIRWHNERINPNHLMDDISKLPRVSK